MLEQLELSPPGEHRGEAMQTGRLTGRERLERLTQQLNGIPSCNLIVQVYPVKTISNRTSLLAIIQWKLTLIVADVVWPAAFTLKDAVDLNAVTPRAVDASVRCLPALRNCEREYWAWTSLAAFEAEGFRCFVAREARPPCNKSSRSAISHW